MTYRDPAHKTVRRFPWLLLAGLLIVLAVITATLGYQSLKPSSQALARAFRPSEMSLQDLPQLSSPASPIAEAFEGLHGEHDGALGAADGVVPAGVTVFHEVPAVANLEPRLLAALRQAASDAAGDGVVLYVNSGWRSREYQQQLLNEAVSTYGSVEEAARWAATPDTSAHVTGDAVDIGPFEATAWLSEHGAGYGLCQVYGNEPWHYELRQDAPDQGCPPMYEDPTQDPRMQP